MSLIEMDYLTGALTGGPQPEAVGQKFDPMGQVLPYGGNTFVCHIPPGPAHQALTAAQTRLREGPLAGAFTFLPPSSFHMTLFEGVCDAQRGDDTWPRAIAPVAALPEVTARFLAATAGLPLPQRPQVRATGLFGGLSVSLTGATPAEEGGLRAARAVLSDATAIRRADFASYDFHITLAYPLRWLTVEEARAVIALSAAVLADLVAAAPVITLGPAEFCTFRDMHAFDPVRTPAPAAQ